MDEGVAILRLAGDAPHLDQALEVMQAFPAGARRLEILAPVEASAQVIPGTLPVLLYLARHAQVTRLPGQAVEHRHAGQDRHVHLGIARVHHAAAGVEIREAD